MRAAVKALALLGVALLVSCSQAAPCPPPAVVYKPDPEGWTQPAVNWVAWGENGCAMVMQTNRHGEIRFAGWLPPMDREKCK